MKVFYIIICAFILTVGGIFLNSKAVSHFADDSIAALECIMFSEGAEFEAEVSKITDEITQRLDKLEFSIQREKTNAIHDYAKLLVTQARLGFYDDFEITKAKLINSLREISDLEKFSFASIF